MGRKVTRKPQASETSKEVISRLEGEGVSPVEVMVASMRDLYGQYEEAREQADIARTHHDAKTQEAIMRYGKDCLRDACEIAKNVAPYFHPRLQAITMAGDGDKPPIGVELTSVDDLRKMVRGGRDSTAPKATENK